MTRHAVDPRAVRAPEIRVDERPAPPGDPAVMARHPAIDGDEVVVGGPADGQLRPRSTTSRVRRRDRSTRRTARGRARPGDREDARRASGRCRRSAGSCSGSSATGPCPPRPAIGSAKRASTRMSVRSTVGSARRSTRGRSTTRVAVRPGERQRAVGELGGEGAGHVAELGQVGRVEVDDEAVRDERPVRGRQALRLHRAFDPALELDRLDARAEEASRRALEESFEEPLDGGERRHGRWRSLAEGPEMPRSARFHPDIRRVADGTHGGGAAGSVRYTLEPLERSRRPGVIRAELGDPMTRDPDRIVL